MKILHISLFLGALTLVSCGTDNFFERGKPATDTTTGTTTTTTCPSGTSEANFDSSLKSLFAASCASCHDNPASSYADAKALVSAGDPSSSTLYKYATGKGHAGGTIWTATSSQATALSTWITCLK